jgi:small subunit ribosomal protein S2
MASNVISMKALLESGVHFGHRTNKWNPAMKPFIFTERNGIHIIDLQQTVKSITTAYNVIRDSVSNGGVVMFVGTKRQAQETIKEEATRCGMPYVTERWLGGTLTNWVTIYQRILELDRLEKMQATGEINRLTKKEGLMIQREINRLHIRLSGLRIMKHVPELIFMIDVGREETALHEANLKEIPVIAMVDTNCDPRGVDYVIPSNDDAIRAIKLVVSKIADAVIEGKAMRSKDEGEQEELPMPVAAFEGPRTRLADEVTDDKELLGAATLAKLGGKLDEELIEEVKAELEAETGVVPEPSSEAASEETEETK